MDKRGAAAVGIANNARAQTCLPAMERDARVRALMDAPVHPAEAFSVTENA